MLEQVAIPTGFFPHILEVMKRCSARLTDIDYTLDANDMNCTTIYALCCCHNDDGDSVEIDIIKDEENGEARMAALFRPRTFSNRGRGLFGLFRNWEFYDLILAELLGAIERFNKGEAPQGQKTMRREKAAGLPKSTRGHSALFGTIDVE